jgi:hypothetical protein
VPYKFSYRFEDDCGRQSKLIIEDWEIAGNAMQERIDTDCYLPTIASDAGNL